MVFIGLQAFVCLFTVFFASSAVAFHDSQIDPQAKQTLDAVISFLEETCEAGNRRACPIADDVLRMADKLVLVDQQCRRGMPQACEAVQYGYAALDQMARQFADPRSVPPAGPRTMQGDLSQPRAIAPPADEFDSPSSETSMPSRQNPNLRWYDQTIAPLRNAQRSYDRAKEIIEKNRSPEAAATYQKCRAEGISATHCQFMAGQQDSMSKLQRDQAEIRRMGEKCEKGDATACEWMRKKQAELASRGQWLDLMGQGQDFRDRVNRSIGDSQRALQDRNQRSHDRNMGRGYYEWADQARRKGDTGAAERYQGLGDYYQGRALVR
jgi:hypothetical protein